MNFVTVWTLRRGIVDPPEPLSDRDSERAEIQAVMDRHYDYRQKRWERDPALSEREWWAEEAQRGGYGKRRKRA